MSKNITLFYAEDSPLFDKYNGNERIEDVEVWITEEFIILYKPRGRGLRGISRSHVEDYEMEVNDE